MSSLLSDSRRAISVAMQGVSGGSITIGNTRSLMGWLSRVQAGPAQGKSIWEDVNTNGPYCLLGPVRDLNFDNLGWGPAICSLLVFLNKVKETSFDATDIDDLISATAYALTKPSNYGTIANPLSLVPRRTKLSKFEYDYQDQDGLICLSWLVEIPDP